MLSSSSSNAPFSNVARLLANEDITDPTDFPSLAPGLRQIDSALRCKICKELIEAPVTLPCGHCYCSICIRGALADKQECPSCRKVANEGHLRTNPLVEEIVTSWLQARPLVLKLSKDEERRLTHVKSPQVGPSHISRSKKRKRSRSPSVLDTPTKAGPSRIQTLSSRDPETPNSRTSSVDNDVDIVPTSDSREEPLSVQDENFVNCPICQRPVRLETINSHIDANCSSTPASDGETLQDRRSKKSEWSNIFGGTSHGEKRKAGKRQNSPIGPDPLPKAAYNVLKDKQVKHLLAVHGLPVIGDRHTLIARHQRWVIIYNGNLDRSVKQRKTMEDLRQELNRWERDRKGKKNTVNDVAAYQKANKAEFAHLIEAARPRKCSIGKSGDDQEARSSEGSSGLVHANEVMVVEDSEEESNLNPDIDGAQK